MTSRPWLALAPLLVAGCAPEPAPREAPPPAPAEKEPAPVAGKKEPRRKQDARPPVLVDGPPIEPEAGLRRWLEARLAKHPRAAFRLPFTFTGDETRRAALGLGAWTHRLEDPALGIPLAERIEQLRRGDPRCTVWLTVRFGGLLPAAPPADPQAPPLVSVMAVHERAPDGARDLVAQSVRGDDDLALRRLRPLHCARGERRCAECQEAASKPADPVLLDLAPDHPEAARPTIGVEREGTTRWCAYDVLRRFASVEEARAFAEAHGVSDVKLDGAE